MEPIPLRINMSDWVQSGEGWNAVSYCHRTDNSLCLKMNSESLPPEHTVREFRKSVAVHALGVRSPETMELVTDGRRYGIITERFLGKRSFARIISEQPEMLEPLAKDMAEAAHVLHSLPCDTTQFDSVPERLVREACSCRWVGRRLRSILKEYAAGMRPVGTCLHGDMHPGNILRTSKGDFWIDMDRFGYGDPDLDYASQFILANLAPASMCKLILHIDQPVYRRFLERYGAYYYGQDFYTSETQERLRRAVCLTLAHALAKSPAACLIFKSYVKGREKPTLAILRLINRLKVK